MNLLHATVSGLVDNLSLRVKVDQATSSEDGVTPAYLLDEVVNSVGASRDRAEAAADAIARRLRHPGASTKEQALRLVRHCSRKGSAELRRALLKSTAGIVRDLTTYNCAPDPFRDHAPRDRVRAAARDALESLHGDGDVGGAGGGGPPSAAGRRNAGGLLAEAHQANKLGLGAEQGGERGAGSGEATGTAGTGRGSGADVGNLLGDGDLAGGPPNAPAAPRRRIEADRRAENLVATLCASGGLRAAPGPEALRAFTTGCEALVASDPAAAGALAAAVGARVAGRGRPASEWQPRLRAVCGLEALALRRGESTPARAVLDAVRREPGALLAAASGASQASLQARARGVAEMLGLEGSPGAGAGARGAGGDLLGGIAGSSAAPATSPVAPAAPSATPPPSLEDLLGGIEVSSLAQGAASADPFAASAPLAGPTLDPFGASRPRPRPASPDLLGAPAAPLPVAAAAAGSPTPPLVDLLSPPATAAPVPAAARPQAPAFGSPSRGPGLAPQGALPQGLFGGPLAADASAASRGPGALGGPDLLGSPAVPAHAAPLTAWPLPDPTASLAAWPSPGPTRTGASAGGPSVQRSAASIGLSSLRPASDVQPRADSGTTGSSFDFIGDLLPTKNRLGGR